MIYQQHCYRLIIETHSQVYVRIYKHNRRGLMNALRKVNSHKLANDMMGACVVSSRCGDVVFSDGEINMLV